MAVKKCPQCKEEMRKVDFDIGYGVEVKSLNCKNCGFNITEENKLEKALTSLKEHMAKETKVIKIGAGLGIRFPNEIVNILKIHKGGNILVKPDADGIKLIIEN